MITRFTLRNAAQHGLVATLALLPLALGLTGCLSRPALSRQTFAFQNPPAAARPSTPGQAVLALRAVQVSPNFDRTSLVYRNGPDSYEVDPYAGLLVAPGRALAIPLAAHLRNSGLFQDVVEPGGPLVAQQFLEVDVTELYGDFSQAAQPLAVMALRLTFVSEGDQGTVTLLRKEYAQRVPLSQKTATAVVAGWNQALTAIMTEAARDFAARGR